MLTQSTEAVRVTVFWQFYDGVCALRAQTEVEAVNGDFPLQYCQFLRADRTGTL